MNYSELNIDKANWTKVSFGKVVREVRTTSKDPISEGLDRLVGLEHIEPENLHIKNWGMIKDGTTFNRKFVKGQVLFGRRRAYLKKAVVADFNGICSGDITVMEARDGLLPELLPFIVQNEKFFDYAIKNSAGSLSPRAKFNDLSSYEFLLPPKNQQAKIAEMLWAADEKLESFISLSNKLKQFLEISSSNLIWPKNLELSPLLNCADRTLEQFIDGDWIESKDQSEKGIRLIQLADIGVRKFLNKSDRYISEDTFKRLRCFEVLPGDILVARMPEPLGRACIIPNIGQKMITAVDCCIIRVDISGFNPNYILYLLNTKEMLSRVLSLASGTTRTRISKKNLEKILVPLPKLEIQNNIVKELELINESLETTLTEEHNFKLLFSSIINKIFN
ncbi:MAG: restriction endonuclease subunit S [bacterium]|nr:restriction endonuclease subunit S [bacterium]